MNKTRTENRYQLAGWIIAVILLSSPLVGAKRGRKLTLAELAALEWKLEQSTTALINKNNAGARKEALKTLAEIPDPRAIQPLGRALREDPDAQIRSDAASALATRRTPEAKGVLQIAAQADPQASVRAAAQGALRGFPRRMSPAKMRWESVPFKKPQKVGAAQFARLLTSPSGDIRLWAVGKMRNVPFPKRKALLVKHLKNDPSTRVRTACAQVLQGVEKKGALPLLIQALADRDPALRFELARLIANRNDPAAVTVLLKVAQEDADKTVRAEASDLLEPVTPAGRRLLARRIRTLRSSNPAQRIAALEALTKFTHWRAMLPLSCSLLADSNLLVRRAATQALSKMHDASVLTALRVAAQTEADASQRKKVRAILGQLRRRVDALVRQLRSKAPAERMIAARALGQAAYGPGLKPLIRAAKDREPRVRKRIIEALRNFDNAQAEAALQQARADKDPEVRKIAEAFFDRKRRIEGWKRFFADVNRLISKTMDDSAQWRADAAVALGVAGAERAASSLIRLLRKDKDVNVRLAAAWALVLTASEAGEKALRRAAAKDPSPRVQLTARKYLVIAKISLEALQGQLHGAKAEDRQDAAEALSLRATGSVMPHLIRAAMCDEVPAVRGAALRGLARMGQPLARTVIRLAQRRDADAHVKRLATMMDILSRPR